MPSFVFFASTSKYPLFIHLTYVELMFKKYIFYAYPRPLSSQCLIYKYCTMLRKMSIYYFYFHAIAVYGSNFYGISITIYSIQIARNVDALMVRFITQCVFICSTFWRDMIFVHFIMLRYQDTSNPYAISLLHKSCIFHQTRTKQKYRLRTLTGIYGIWTNP